MSEKNCAEKYYSFTVISIPPKSLEKWLNAHPCTDCADNETNNQTYHCRDDNQHVRLQKTDTQSLNDANLKG